MRNPVLRLPHVFVLLIMTSVALSGCVGDDDTVDPPEPATSADGSGAGADDDAGRAVTRPPASTDRAPTWNIGDYWVYKDGAGNQNTFAVSGDTGTDYIIDTDSELFAFFNALEDISTLGAQRQSDLAGSQGSDRIEFFRFPLQDGATWTTTWDGATRTITTTALGDGTYGFASNAEDGTPHARYTYDPAARWFGALEFLAPDGTTLFANQLVEAGTGYTGELIRYDIETVFDRNDDEGDTPVQYDAVTAEFTQSETHTDVFLSYGASCGAGHILFTVVPDEPTSDTQGHSDNTPCPKSSGFFGSLGSQPGQWGITLIRATDSDAAFNAQVHLRTRTTITPGAES